VIVGSTGKTAKKILSEKGFKKGALDEITIHTKDIGDVYQIILSETVTDPWGPETISV